MAVNCFFKITDQMEVEVEGYAIDPIWWSRVYEYPWAIQFSHSKSRAADMGCGFPERPFKDMLAKRSGFVYAVDAKPEINTLKAPHNMIYHVADFSKRTRIPDGWCGRVFCISVLEDLGEALPGALREFKRVLTRAGKVVITLDVQFDMDRPIGKYPGVDLDKFIKQVYEAGLRFVGEIDLSKENAVNHPEFNLCCFHCLLEHDAQHD